jgi:DNA-binding MurR/RpiR family transcriptional regulator
MNKTTPGADLSARMRLHLDDMAPAEKKLANLILEYPGGLASHSASEITVMAGVSNAAMTRLVKRIGYDSYDQMRRLARDGMESGSPLFLLKAAALEQGPDADMIEQQLGASIANLQDTFRAIDDQAVEPIVRAIALAPRVSLFGQRNSYFFAAYLRWQLIQFRGNVHLLPGAGETLAEHVAGLGAGDVVILFGLRRRVALTEQLIEAIHRQGASTLLVTDSGKDGGLGATWVLRCQTHSAMPLDNHVSVMALCHVLSAKLIALSGANGRKHLARIEQLHDDLREF